MWFRFYTEALDSPKVQRLPDSVFKGWVNILCLAKEGDGLLPSVEDIAFRLRMSESEAQGLVEELAKRGLLDSDGKNATPHNWDTRQYDSDSSAERMRRHRQRNRHGDGDSDVTVTVQSRDRAETEADTEQSRGGSGEDPSPAASRAPRRSARPPQQCGEDVLVELENSPAYAHLDVRLCYFKMVEWCKRNRKIPTEKRFVNWLNHEDKPMTAKSSPSKQTGNASVGKSAPIPVSNPAATEKFMAESVEELIAADDFESIGQLYDAIVQRGGAKAEWEIRCVAYYELHKNEPATTEQVAELKGKIAELVPRSAR